MKERKDIPQKELAIHIFKFLNFYFIISILISSLIIIFNYSFSDFITISISSILHTIISSLVYGFIFFIFLRAVLSLKYHREQKLYSNTEIKKMSLILCIIISIIYGLSGLLLGVENSHEIIIKSYITMIIFYLIQRYLIKSD